MQNNELLTMAETTAKLKLSRRTVERLAEKGILKKFKIVGTDVIRFRSEDVDSLLKSAYLEHYQFGDRLAGETEDQPTGRKEIPDSEGVFVPKLQKGAVPNILVSGKWQPAPDGLYRWKRNDIEVKGGRVASIVPVTDQQLQKEQNAKMSDAFKSVQKQKAGRSSRLEAAMTAADTLSIVEPALGGATQTIIAKADGGIKVGSILTVPGPNGTREPLRAQRVKDVAGRVEIVTDGEGKIVEVNQADDQTKNRAAMAASIRGNKGNLKQFRKSQK